MSIKVFTIFPKTSSLESDFLHGSCNNIKRAFHALYPVLPVSFVCVTKETGERKIRRSLAARLISLRFSHRFQRIAKAPLIWYSASPNDLGLFSLIHLFLKQ